MLHRPTAAFALLAMMMTLTIVGGCRKDAEEQAAQTPLQSSAVTKRFAQAQSRAVHRPDDAAAQVAFGKLALEHAAYNDAYRAYRRAAVLDPKNYEAVVGLAQTNLKLQNPTEGLDWLARAKKLRAADPELKELEARLLLINGNFDKSIAAFESALKMNPKRVTTWLNLASAYSLMNRPADAVRTAREAVKVDRLDPAPQYALGRHLERAKDYIGAEAAYRKALSLDTGNASVMTSLARLLMKQNRRLEEARQMAIKASQLRIDRADAAVVAAWILHLQGDDRKCANELIKLVNASPQNPEAWQKLSVVLSNLGKTAEASKAAEMARRFIPGRRAAADLRMLDSGGAQ
ncbi:MAG: tetratricopeptide repeat protein [Bacteroidota bacterium]